MQKAYMFVSVQIVAALQAAGGHPRLIIYPDADHDAWTATYTNPELYTWLFTQKR